MYKPTATTLAALLVASGAFAQVMEVTENGSREGAISSSDLFTGTAYIDPVFADMDPLSSMAVRLISSKPLELWWTAASCLRRSRSTAYRVSLPKCPQEYSQRF